MNHLKRLIVAALAVAVILAPVAFVAAPVHAADKHMAHQAYTTQVFQAQVLAATATEAHVFFTAPRACRVVQVSVTADIATTGDNTNTKNLNLVNKGAAGSGTTEVGNLDLVTGVNLAAFDEKVIPLNASNASGVVLANGDVLALQYEKVGTGVNVGALTVNVLWEPN
jgi:hypothetical protein